MLKGMLASSSRMRWACTGQTALPQRQAAMARIGQRRAMSLTWSAGSATGCPCRSSPHAPRARWASSAPTWRARTALHSWAPCIVAEAV